MTKNSMQALLCSQMDDKDIVVKNMVVWDLPWPGYSECRLFTDGNEVYSAMFHEDEKITDFVLCKGVEK